MSNIFRSAQRMLRNTQQDEWQRTTEGNIAKNSLLFAFVVVVAGGFSMNHYQWASPLWLALAEITLVGWWYMAQVIWRGAYFTLRGQQNAWGLALCGAVTVMATSLQIQTSVTQKHWFWHDGHVGSGLFSFISGLYFLTLVLLAVVRYRLDRRAEKIED